MVSAETLSRIRAGLGDREPGVRAQAVEALAALGDVGGLVAALGSEDRYLRRYAISSLAREPGMRLTWRLARKRHDPCDDVRVALAHALAARGGWLAARLLRTIARHDASARVRHAALHAAADLGSCGAHRVLGESAAHDPDPDVRAMARVLLRRRAEVKQQSREARSGTRSPRPPCSPP
jgi:HEAT repeat protein